MMGEKHKRDGFCNTEWKRAKTESTEEQYLFGFMREPPSLQRIATISVAIRLWTQPNVLKIFDDCLQQHHFVTDEDYDKIEKGVRKKLAATSFPNFLKVNISNIIGPIGYQLDLCFFWSKAKYSFLHSLFKERGLIYWTMQGTIDMSKSLKTLINYQKHLNSRVDLFTLACYYCLDDCISDLWGKIPSDTESSYANYADHLVAYWIAYLRNQLSTFLRNIKSGDHDDIYDMNCSIHQNMVSLSIHEGNVNSLKYFWYKLLEVEKIDNIEYWLYLAVEHSVMPEYLYCMYGRGNDYINVVCFLLPYLSNQSELKGIFRNDSGRLLKSLFFCWPHNHFFLRTLNLMMMFNYLRVDHYVNVMECMIENIKEHQIGDLFEKVWLSSSLKYKKSFITYITKRMSVSMKMLWDLEVFCMILNSSSSAEKKDIILSMIRVIERDNYSEILNVISTYVPKTVSADQEINLLKMGILLNSEFVRKLLHYAGVQTAEQIVSLGFQALNKVQTFQKEEINVREIYKALVIIGNKEYIEQFLRWRYESDDEIIKLKISIINCPMSEWFPQWIDYKKGWRLECIITENSKIWEVYEKLIHDSLCSPTEIVQFKKDHLSDVIGLVQLGDFETALMFLSWFFISIEGVEVGLMNAKQLYEAIIILGNFNYVEQFLKLQFGTEYKIMNFKKPIMDCPLNQLFSNWNLKDLIPNSCERWNVYEKLINYYFSSSEEVARFKEKQASNAVNFVEQGDSELASMFLNWCFDSNEAVKRYKSDYLVSPEFLAYLICRICRLSRVIKIVKEVIKWFSPTPTEVKILKIHLQCERQNFLRNQEKLQRIQALIYLLDCFVQECNTSIFSADDDDVVKNILKGNLNVIRSLK